MPAYSPGNPFAARIAPPSRVNPYEPGSQYWWLERLIMKLLDRYERYNTLEDYALGNHPLPNTDYRYQKALKNLQRKALTNYCELIINATTERLNVKGFRFGPVGEADADAKKIWDYNEMDYQSVVNIKTAATFGVCYALVGPPDPNDPDGQPSICIEDPKMCVVERDPYKMTKSLAGLKMWQDDTLELVVAVLYMKDYIYTFTSRESARSFPFEKDVRLSRELDSTPVAASFTLELVQPNPLGDIPLIEGNWQPAFGELGRAEHEGVLDIQDRINHTVLDRLVIAKSQAFRQRWATGITPPGRKGTKKPPFDPGADMLWVTANPDATFGDFETADIDKIQKVVEMDVGHMAAITKTPAHYLMNRVVNVSGDTLTQDQSGLVMKVRQRQQSMGHFYELVMRTAFKYISDERSKDIHADVLWSDPEIRTLAESADAFTKFSAGGLPIELIMEMLNFTPDQIAFAKEAVEKKLAEEQAREDEVAARDHENAVAMEKAKPRPSTTKK